MPALPELELIPPSSWKEFESLCFQLFKLEWDDPFIQRNGRQGQAQNGVDIIGTLKGKSVGLQCKGKQTYPEKQVTVSEITIEIKAAKSFQPPLDEYIILTSSNRDSKIQESVRILNAQNKEENKFSIHIFFWEDIRERLIKYPELIKLFYSFLSSVSTEKLKVIENKADRIEKTTDSILEKMSSLGISSIELTSISISDEIDFVKQLMKTHKPDTALDYLNKLKTNKWDKISNDEKYKILSNIGIVYTQIDEFLKAGEYFKEAFELNKNDNKAKINLAISYTLAAEKQKAIDLANEVIKDEPLNVDAHCLIFRNSSSTIEQSISELPKEILNEAKILHAIGYKYYLQKNYLKSVDYFNQVSKNNMEVDSSIKLSIAALKLEIVNSKQINKKEFHIKEFLEEILKIYDDEINSLKDSEEIKYKYQLFINRGLTKQYLDRDAEAEEDYMIAFNYNKNDDGIKRNLSLIYFDKNREKGIKFLKDNISQEKAFEDKLLLSDFYRISGDFIKSEELLNDIIIKSPPVNIKRNALRILETVYEQQDLLDKANEINLQRITLDPKDILSRVDSANRSKANGNEELSNEKLREAKGYIDNNSKLHDLSTLSNALYINKLYEDAIDVFEKFVNVKEDTKESRSLLNSYYQMKKWDKALELCKSIRIITPNDVSILSVETHIYEQLGNMFKAESLFLEFLENYDSAEVKIYLGLLYLRMGEMNKLDTLLRIKIDVSTFPNELNIETQIHLRFQLAQLYSVRDFKEKLFPLMYETRKKYFNNSGVHSSYVWLLMERGNKDLDLLNLKVVKNDTVVYLKRENEENYYILDDYPDADLSKKEVNSSNPVYQKLLNKKIDDEVILLENQFIKEKWKIVDIKSKYIAALYESMSDFNKYFPTDTSLQKITVDTKSPKEMLDMMLSGSDEKKQTFEDLLKLYKKGKVTLGMIAKFFKRNLAEIWTVFIRDEEIGLINNTGTKDEIFAIKNNFSLDTNFVIDLISLNTLVNLKINDSTLKKLNKFYIVQDVIDEINFYLAENDSIKGLDHLHIYKEGETFFKEEVTEEVKSKRRTYFNDLLYFIKNYCEVIPLEPHIISDVPNYDKMRKLIGASSLHSILLAKQLNGLLYSDDLILRLFSEGQFKITGFFTQILLSELFINNFISIEEYHQYIIILAEMNYKHTSINSDTILYCLKKSDWEISYSCKKLFSILMRKNSEDTPAFLVASNLMFSLWQELVPNDKKEPIFKTLLDYLFKDRNVGKYLPDFLSSLKLKFKGFDDDYTYLMSILNTWLKEKR